jgi:alkyl-hydroperoxide reductase/thiol specific antioxidant family protein
VQLHRDRERFEAAGLGLVVIGQGTPAHALEFRARNDIEGLTMLVDETRASYDAAGAKVATVAELLGPRVVVRGAVSGLRSRLPQTATKGHPAQLGGVLLVLPDGSIPYAHLAEDASDNAATDEILAAAERVR